MEHKKSTATVTLSMEEYEELKAAQGFLKDFENKVRYLINKIGDEADVSLYAEFKTLKHNSDIDIGFAVRVLEKDAFEAIKADFDYVLEEYKKNIRECFEAQLRLAEHGESKYKQISEELQDRIDRYNNASFFYQLLNEV